MIFITIAIAILLAIFTQTSYAHGMFGESDSDDSYVPAPSHTNTVNSPQLNSFYYDSIDMSNFLLKKTKEMPVLFLSHAAPVLIMNEKESIMGRQNDSHFKSKVANWYRAIPTKMNLVGPNKPLAIVQFSAHYDTGAGPIKVMAQDVYKNGLLYDYYGFPKHTYDVKYPAPGSAQLAKQIVTMLTSAGIQSALDTQRGIDHGGFIPLMLMYPDADIPVLQISVCNSAEKQRRIGEILAPLRHNGILFIGSGQATHGSFQPSDRDIKEQEIFAKALTKGLLPVDWCNERGDEVYTSTTSKAKTQVETTPDDNGDENARPETMSSDEVYAQRASTVDNWAKLPGARASHSHYDHYMPIPGCVGLTKGSEDSNMNVVGDHWLAEMHCLRSFVWGEYPFTSMYEEEPSDITAPVAGKDEL